MTELVRMFGDTRTPSAFRRAFVVDIALIVAVFGATLVVIRSVVDVPLIDDWAYGRTLEHLLKTGDYRPLHDILQPMITNLLWGGLFCVPAGFSYAALHVSTIVASLIGLAGTYLLVRDLEQARRTALLVSLNLGLSPIYYMLSQTFQTDVLFTALVVWASVFLARNLRDGSNLSLLIGAALSAAATLSRQLALCVPIAFAMTSLFMAGNARGRSVRALFPLILSGSAFVGLRLWLVATGRIPSALDGKTVDLLQGFFSVKHLATRGVFNSFALMAYVGLFLYPIVVVAITANFRSRNHRARAHVGRWIAIVAAGTVVIVLGASVRVHYGGMFPTYEGSDVGGPGGSRVLMPFTGWYLQLLLEHLPPFGDYDRPIMPVSSGFWIVVTIVSVSGALVVLGILARRVVELVPRLLDRNLEANADAPAAFFVFSCIMYSLPLLSLTILEDRYLVPLIPLVSAAILSGSGRNVEFDCGRWRWRYIAGFAVLALYGSISVASTHDYLALERVRWHALSKLMGTFHVEPKDIDGGYEFSGLYLYQDDPVHPEQSGWRSPDHPTYRLELGAAAGYVVMTEYHYRQWLPPCMRVLVILKRE